MAAPASVAQTLLSACIQAGMSACPTEMGYLIAALPTVSTAPVYPGPPAAT
jgi:hypothetical protein